MPQRQCALCDVELTPENDSEEHLLPNAIGGRRTVSGFLCVACNNRTGSSWDVEVARQLHFLTLKLGVVRERGETPVGEFKTLSGASIRIHPDGCLSYPAAKPTITEENGAVHIQIQARIQARLRHAKADTTANEYMQELPESVQEMVDSAYLMLASGAEQNHGSGDLQQKRSKARSRDRA